MGLIINGNEFVSDTTLVTSHNIGDIFYTTRLDTELNGAVECNGGQYNIDDYSGIGSIKELLLSNKIPYISINEFDTKISESGSCGYFGYGIDTIWSQWEGGVDYVYTNKTSVDTAVGDPVYDAPGGNIIGNITWVNFEDRTAISYEDTNGESHAGYIYGSVNGPVDPTPYFKVPKLNKVYIKADSSNIGQYLSAGLPNILGTYTNSAWGKSDETPIVSGALYRAGIGNKFGALGNTAIRNDIMSFDASRSSSIYGNSDTVTPETICLRPMIQLFTGVLETSVATCNSVLVDISGLKQEKLSIPSLWSNDDFASFRKVLEELDYGSTITNITSPYTTPNDGVIRWNNGGTQNATVDGITVYIGGNDTSNEGPVFLPVLKGQVITFAKDSGTATFVPYKNGVEGTNNLILGLNYYGSFSNLSTLNEASSSILSTSFAKGRWALVGSDASGYTRYYTAPIDNTFSKFEWVKGSIDTYVGAESDYVIDTQKPTAENGYTWYRLYKSGWVEQGGSVDIGGSASVSLPVVMRDSYYSIVLGNRSGQYEQILIQNQTTTGFGLRNANSGGTVSSYWIVNGFSEV